MNLTIVDIVGDYQWRQHFHESDPYCLELVINNGSRKLSSYISQYTKQLPIKVIIWHKTAHVCTHKHYYGCKMYAHS